MYGRVRSQLTHEYVQTSTRTTRPRSASAVSGSEVSQPGAASSAVSALWRRGVEDIAGQRSRIPRRLRARAFPGQALRSAAGSGRAATDRAAPAAPASAPGTAGGPPGRGGGGGGGAG